MVANNRWLVLDNGSHTCKYASAGEPSSSPAMGKVWNYAARPKGSEGRRRWVGVELDLHCRDYTSLQFNSPMDQGYLTNWQLEVEVWERLFAHIKCEPVETQLLLTEPLFNPVSIQHTYDQIVFEYFQVPAYVRTSAPTLAVQGMSGSAQDNWAYGCHMVVDVGHSFTHVIPYLGGVPILAHAYRIDVGGKLLTAQLMQQISFRQWNMLDEMYIVNGVKEACCYVAQDFTADLHRFQRKDRSLLQRYVLPDFSRNLKGHVKDPSGSQKPAEGETLLLMGNERIAIPELLFRPSNLVREKNRRLDQAGIPEVIANAIEQVAQDPRWNRNDKDVQATLVRQFYANLHVIGGSCQFPGFQERLERELRQFAPTKAQVVVTVGTDLSALQGGLSMVQQPSLSYLDQHVVTREEWQEQGDRICKQRFHF